MNQAFVMGNEKVHWSPGQFVSISAVALAAILPQFLKVRDRSLLQQFPGQS